MTIRTALSRRARSGAVVMATSVVLGLTACGGSSGNSASSSSSATTSAASASSSETSSASSTESASSSEMPSASSSDSASASATSSESASSPAATSADGVPSAAELEKNAQGALAKAKSLKLEGNISGMRVTMAGQTDGSNETDTVVQKGVTVSALRVGGKTFVRQGTSGPYMVAPAGLIQRLNQFSLKTFVSKMTTGSSGGKGTVTRGTDAGKDVYILADSSNSKIYVLADGSWRPVKFTSGSNSGEQLTIADYDKVAPVKAPTGSQLKK